MARDWALRGVDRSELTPPPPPEQPKGFTAKCQNFWYHYKFMVIGGGFVLALLIWLLIHLLTSNPPDYNVVVVTELPLIDSEVAALETYMAAGGEDIDGDGQVEVTIENITPRYHNEMSPSIATADNDKLQAHIATGEVMLYVFDKASYNDFMKTVANVTEEDYIFFAPLSTAAADYNTEEHYWNWKGDARIAQGGMANFPENLYFGVREPAGMASSAASAKLSADGKALLETLISTAQK